MRTMTALTALLLCAAGQAQTVDICDRTPQVRDALLEAVDADDCAAVDSDSLAGVKTLNLRSKQVTALRAGDFDGLTSLRWLYLDHNQLTALPDGVFDGLDRLLQLWLHDNQLTALPAGVFDGLDRLLQLWLHDNQLTALPAGVFDGLAGLLHLDLRDNHLAGLTRNDALFAGLSSEADILLDGRLVAAVPLLLSNWVTTQGNTMQGFVRIINESNESGSVRVIAYDDMGWRYDYDPIEIRLGARQVFQFNADDLEDGNPNKGIEGIGGHPTSSGWRLDLETDLAVRVLAFIRHGDGFLTAMHDVLPRDADGRLVAHTFNPGSNRNQVSTLNFVNTRAYDEIVSIEGVDDQGVVAGPVTLLLPPGRSGIGAARLENGVFGDGDDALGDGAGKWRLFITARDSVVGMSRLYSVNTGHLTNISTAGVATEGDGGDTGDGDGDGGDNSDDHGDGRGDATTIGVDERQSGRIDAAGDVDWFRISATESGTLTAYTTGSLDTVGRLRDSAGSQLTTNDDGGAGANFRIERDINAGTYFVTVEANDDSATGSYILHTEFESNSNSNGGGGLRITTDAPPTVVPLSTVPLTVLGGDADAEYQLFMDLSGSGEFADEDTIEVAPVASEGRLLVAAPLPETLAEGNAARSFAVRVRERDGEAVTAPITLALGRVSVPDSLAGHPTVILDVVLKGVYEGLDDPLLTVEAGAIDPARSWRVAEALGLSTAYSDAQAEALLRSMFGVSSTDDALTSGTGTAPSTHAAALRFSAARCIAPDALCNAYQRLYDCVGDAIDDAVSGTPSGTPHLQRCTRIVREDVVEAWDDFGEKIRSAGNFLRRAAPRLANALRRGQDPKQKLFDLNAAARQFIGLNKTLRTSAELAESLADVHEAMRDASRSLTEGNPDLVAEVEREAVADGEREARFDLVEEADHNQRDAAAIKDLQDVYTGNADVVETLGTVAAGDGSSGAAACGADYEEFTVDDKTSTCVWSSLVEWNCYAGSRQVSHPDLGGANACLYYSLDHFEPDGSCRENYAKVNFQGRETCRWAELGIATKAWYTLEKEHGVESPQTPVDGDGEILIACRLDSDCPRCSCCGPRYHNDDPVSGRYLGWFCGKRRPPSNGRCATCGWR